MNDSFAVKIIARMHSDFPAKFGIPRQSGLVDALKSTVVFESAYRNPDAVRGLEDFSHIWLIWQFSETMRESWSPTVRPPRMGGNTRMGVFATRSPFRPNALGLSCVKLDFVEQTPTLGPVLHVSGADLMDGTPILDIKPYLPGVDCHPEALGGFADQFRAYAVKVDFPEELLCRVPEERREALLGILEQDPRPAYQSDPARLYGLSFGGWNVRFSVRDGVLSVHEVSPVNESADQR